MLSPFSYRLVPCFHPSACLYKEAMIAQRPLCPQCCSLTLQGASDNLGLLVSPRFLLSISGCVLAIKAAPACFGNAQHGVFLIFLKENSASTCPPALFLLCLCSSLSTHVKVSCFNSSTCGWRAFKNSGFRNKRSACTTVAKLLYRMPTFLHCGAFRF